METKIKSKALQEFTEATETLVNPAIQGWREQGGTNCGSTESYNCYKIIATDMDLPKPWLEPGKEEPESLAHEIDIRQKRLQEPVQKK